MRKWETGFAFPTTSQDFSQLLSVQQTEIKINLPNMQEKDTIKFDHLKTFAMSVIFIASEILPGQTKTYCRPQCPKSDNLLYAPIPL